MIRDPRPRSARWLSTSIPEAQWQGSLARTPSAEYNVNNLVSPVLFQEALWHVPENAVVLEIAPHALLQVRPAGPRAPGGSRVRVHTGQRSGPARLSPQAVLKRGLKPSCTVLPLMKKDHADNLRFLLGSVGRLHLAGWVCAHHQGLSGPLLREGRRGQGVPTSVSGSSGRWLAVGVMGVPGPGAPLTHSPPPALTSTPMACSRPRSSQPPGGPRSSPPSSSGTTARPGTCLPPRTSPAAPAAPRLLSTPSVSRRG